MNFKSKHSLELRKEESNKIINKYPDRIPIIVEKHKSCNYDISKTKFLSPKNLTLGQFVYIIRKNIKLSPEKAIFVTINGLLPPTSALMSDLYDLIKMKMIFIYYLFI